MHILHITRDNKEDFSKYVNERGTLVFVYSSECGYCDDMKDAWRQLEITAENMPHNYQLMRINSEVLQDINKKFNVEGFPTILTLHKKGKVHNIHNGKREYEDLLLFLNKNLNKTETGKKTKGGGTRTRRKVTRTRRKVTRTRRKVTRTRGKGTKKRRSR